MAFPHLRKNKAKTFIEAVSVGQTCEHNVRTENVRISVPKCSSMQIKCQVQALPFREDKTLIFQPHENPQWPEGLEFCDIVSVEADTAPKINISLQNPTKHITLYGRTIIGTVQSVGSVYPASIFKTDHAPTASIHHVQAQSSSESTLTNDQWHPPVDLIHLNERQRQIVSQMLREESESFSRSDDIGCVENLQMNISLKDHKPVSRTYLFQNPYTKK